MSSKKPKRSRNSAKQSKLAKLIAQAPPPPVLPDNFEEEYNAWWNEDLYKVEEQAELPPKKKKNKKKKAKIYLPPPSNQEMLDQVTFDLATAWKGDVVLAYDKLISPSDNKNCPFCHQSMEKSYFWTVLAAILQWILMPLSFFSSRREKSD